MQELALPERYFQLLRTRKVKGTLALQKNYFDHEEWKMKRDLAPKKEESK
jgi:hypothetical protein